MKIAIEKKGDFFELEKILERMNEDLNVKSLFVIDCDKNNYEKDKFDKILTKMRKPVFGGIFPGIIYDEAVHYNGTIVAGFSKEASVEIFENIEEKFIDYRFRLKKYAYRMNSKKTIIVNVDGLSKGFERLKEELFYNLGTSSNYIGGGAGSVSFDRKPVVISNQGLLKGAAVLAFLDIPSGIGVGHGWRRISEPIKITEVKGNEIISINWENAYELYKGKVEKLSNVSFENRDFFDIAKNFPLGISKMDSDMIVRDPIAVKENSSIICVGEIPSNSFVHILGGDAKSLVSGTADAKKVAEESFAELNDRKISDDKLVLFIDCVSRALFLEDKIHCEIKSINEPGAIGALTIGEIANTGQSYLEIYNKISVIGLLEV